MTNMTINTAVSTQQTSNISKFINDGAVYREGNQIFRMGDRLEHIYVVNSGVVKLMTMTEAGEEHIVRFCMPGDLLGVEALGDGISNTCAIVLSIAKVSHVPLSDVFEMKTDFDTRDLMQRIANTLAQETEHCLIISQATAGQRVAWFLNEYARKLACRGLVCNIFDMPMTRSDIALYLGLAVETVSRELAKFCKKGILSKQLKRIEILDLNALQTAAKNTAVLH